MKRKSIIICCAVLCVIALSLVIVFVNKPNSKPSGDTDTSTKTISEIKKDLFKDMKPDDYGYNISTDESSGSKDIVKTFTDYPSTLVKEPSELKYKDTLYELENNLSKYNHSLITDEYLKENGFDSADEALIVNKVNLDLSNHNKIKNVPDIFEEEIKDCHIFSSSKNNGISIYLVSAYFETYEDFVQASYDLFYETIHTYSPDELKNMIAFKVDNMQIGTLFESIDKGDYRILFDALMNDKIAILFTNKDNIKTKIEMYPLVDKSGNQVDAFTLEKTIEF